jgi:P27 family predicted phage terminase small subunit
MAGTKKGRKPLPTKLKVLKGTDQPCRINKNEPQPPVCFPDPPKEATDAVKKFWPKIAGQLYDCGILTEIDAYSLSAYCELYLRWGEANKNIAKHGLIIKSPTGYPIQSPWLAISSRALDQMQKIAAEFGMTPSSRTGISVDPGLKIKKNRFANL